MWLLKLFARRLYFLSTYSYLFNHSLFPHYSTAAHFHEPRLLIGAHVRERVFYKDKVTVQSGGEGGGINGLVHNPAEIHHLRKGGITLTGGGEGRRVQVLVAVTLVAMKKNE